MREIKLRAWDKKEKKMHYGNMEMFDDMIGFRFGHFGIDTSKEDIELMQCTGLEDIKGKEIYGGDIVEVSTLGINYKRDYIKGVVEPIDGCYTVTFLSPVYDVTLKVQRKSLYVKCFTVNQDIKVIGSIHENPEIFEGVYNTETINQNNMTMENY